MAPPPPSSPPRKDQPSKDFHLFKRPSPPLSLRARVYEKGFSQHGWDGEIQILGAEDNRTLCSPTFYVVLDVQTRTDEARMTLPFPPLVE